MKSLFLISIIVLASLCTKAQEWDDPMTTSDWDLIWKSSFIQSDNAANAPESSGWFWGINMNHSSNSSSYRYNGQIAIKNDHDTPTIYFRSTNQSGSGIWSKIVHSYSNSYIGNLTTINSLRVHGNNLHGKDLTFMNNSGSMLIGWNRSASHGETDFISNRGAGSLGGFEFREIDNTGNETLLMKLQGDGSVGIGTSNPARKIEIGDESTNFSAFGRFDGFWSTDFERHGRLEFNDKNFGIGAGRLSNNGSDDDLYLWSYDGEGRDISFLSTSNGETDPSTWNHNMIIKGTNGFIGIGTPTPDSKLTVAGNIHSREVKVTIDAGADFVFNESYELRTLEETEQFITENKHLPEIASENEMQEKGLLLGEMNIKLLQKVEELTLYLIEQNKEIKELKEKVNSIENE